MDLAYFTTRLTHNAAVIRSLVQAVTLEQARWKPNPAEWSILEVINHLYDEEREDFRTRLDLALHRPGQPWPGIDPEGWVVERQYNQRDLEESLHNFLTERERSLAWLNKLAAPAWENHYEHPTGRKLSAGDLLVSWLAHDFLHTRQLAQLHWQYITIIGASYSTNYAGAW